MNTYIELVKTGTYYYPAYKHYGKVCNVVCDRCHKSHIICCIGLNTSDLCLDCVNIVLESIHIPPPDNDDCTLMLQAQFNERPTRMLQDMYTAKTKMLQHMYKKK
jgi:hypothetical protein